ncbi:Serine-threonine/tyrosine-protein kinase, catalytic domain [Dillenia turbinata]|uniref:Serine-threonine/tyrosine-protein kinase, catalytic domain n=1 Tax=Dillenia turbinata TaxID=194707 RepID=A0AAN8ZKL1_9MAGN
MARMEIRREEEGKQYVIVVLDGIKVYRETGAAALRWVLRNSLRQKDELLVLILLKSKDSGATPASGFCCIGSRRNEDPCKGDQSIKILHQHISQRKEAYKQILRPYYDICKTNEVKFHAKVAAVFRPKEIIMEEAINVEATWIVMDRCIARELNFKLSSNLCNITVVSENEQAVTRGKLHSDDNLEASETKLKQKYPCPLESKLWARPSSLCPSTSRETEENLLVKTSQKIEKRDIGSPVLEEMVLPNNICTQIVPEVTVAPKQPTQLSWNIVEDITDSFTRRICTDISKDHETYYGYMADCESYVLVKVFKDVSDAIVKAEEKAALQLYHKNILSLVGYHHSKHATAVVFPAAVKGTLEKFLYDTSIRGKGMEFKFQEKMKIALGIAQGVRYMHEECPRAPVVHGNLSPCNIFLRHDLQPMISGFQQATWLHPGQACLIAEHDRCNDDEASEDEATALLKVDIFAFGLLLLRLFCRISPPKDDKSLIEWARPLLKLGAYHELLGKDTDDHDPYGIYRVMGAATRCTSSSPLLRSSMSEVISILRGEASCAAQLSPLSDDDIVLDYCI